MNRNGRLSQGISLGGIDTSDSDHADILGRDGVLQIRKIARESFSPCVVSNRRTMEIATHRGFERMKIGMRVEPEHEQIFTPFRCSFCKPSYGPSGNRMVAAEEDGKRIVAMLVCSSRKRLNPRDHFTQMMNCGIWMINFIDMTRCGISKVLNFVPQIFQCGVKSGETQGTRPHFAPQMPSANP